MTDDLLRQVVILMAVYALGEVLAAFVVLVALFVWFRTR